MRSILLAFALALCGPAFADAPRSIKVDIKHRVDLSNEGALEAIQRDDPVRYGKIEGIIQAAQVTSCVTLPALLRTRYDVRSTQCTPYLLLTSYPPKSRLTFVIEDTQYAVNVVQLKLAPAKATPAVDGRQASDNMCGCMHER